MRALVIEITPEMIEAGAKTLRLASVCSDPCDAAREVVEDILVDMLRSSDMYRDGRLRLLPTWQSAGA